jgi:hypothetical protein
MPATDAPGTDLPDGGLAGLVLRAARDLARLDTAFDAELLMSTLLGGVYAGTLPDREQALAAFIRDLDGYLSDTGTAPALLARAVVAALSGAAGEAAEDVHGAASLEDGPAWIAALGTARATGGWAFGDRYGDQTTYVVTFGYPDESTGGPEHAVLLLVDHNLGLVKDLVVAAPAGPVIDGIRDSVTTDPDEMTWLAEIDPAIVRAAAAGYLRATDNAPEPPVPSGLRDNRAIVAARLATLPEPARRASAIGAEAVPSSDQAGAADQAGADAGTADGAEAVDDRATLVTQFLRSPEAKLSGLSGAVGARGEAIGYGLGLIVDFADARGGDPLRWSPRAVEVFLMDWVHGRAVLDEADARSLPDALGAWVLWAGRLLALPDVAIQATFDEVSTRRAEFVRLCETGERQTPAVKAMRRLIADAVDITDDAAVDAWLRAHESET